MHCWKADQTVRQIQPGQSHRVEGRPHAFFTEEPESDKLKTKITISYLEVKLSQTDFDRTSKSGESTFLCRSSDFQTIHGNRVYKTGPGIRTPPTHHRVCCTWPESPGESWTLNTPRHWPSKRSPWRCGLEPRPGRSSPPQSRRGCSCRGWRAAGCPGSTAS